jgi:hypothetical protein
MHNLCILIQVNKIVFLRMYRSFISVPRDGYKVGSGHDVSDGRRQFGTKLKGTLLSTTQFEYMTGENRASVVH